MVLEEHGEGPLRRLKPDEILPAKRSVPLIGSAKPAMAWSSVVLPPPEGPITPQSAPAGTLSV